MKPWYVLLVVGVIGACGGDGNPDAGPQGPFEPVPEPATVIIIDAELGSAFGSVTVHLANSGESGVFKLEFYGLPTSPNGPNTFFGSTEPVEVDADYDESPTYTVRTSPDEPPLEYILAFTRDHGSATYRQTDRFDLP